MFFLFSENYLAHYGRSKLDGAKVGSGRYPLGSGENPRAASRRSNKSSDGESVNKARSVESTIGRGKQFTDSWLDNIGSSYISDFDNTSLEVQRRVYPSGKVEYMNVATFLKAWERDYGMGKIPDEFSTFHNKGGRFKTGDINPGWGEPGTTQNCTKCAAAFELNLRGYDVQAGRSQYPVNGSKASEYWFENAHSENLSYGDTANYMLSQVGSKGYASGQLCFAYNEHSGHAVHWTARSDGSITINDGQSGRQYRSLDEAMADYGADQNLGMIVTRWDNCHPNWDHMVEDNVLRTTYGTNKVYGRDDGKLYDRW